ncbi:MAG: hypothetical protein F4Y03_14585, partial [Alphaproteobacteria bacterium]|nr:hypothetical protein [Alphaproteobacteria bacterium]
VQIDLVELQMPLVEHRPALPAAVGRAPPTLPHGAGRRNAGQGIARELTGRPRNRLFCYDRYLSILAEGTEAL